MQSTLGRNLRTIFGELFAKLLSFVGALPLARWHREPRLAKNRTRVSPYSSPVSADSVPAKMVNNPGTAGKPDPPVTSLAAVSSPPDNKVEERAKVDDQEELECDSGSFEDEAANPHAKLPESETPKRQETGPSHSGEFYSGGDPEPPVTTDPVTFDQKIIQGLDDSSLNKQGSPEEDNSGRPEAVADESRDSHVARRRPEARGGHPLGPAEQQGQNQTREQPIRRRPAPDVLCKNEDGGWRWSFCVELNDDWPIARQGGLPDQEMLGSQAAADGRNGEFQLNSALDPIEIQANSGEKKKLIALWNPAEPSIFRLSNLRADTGHRAKVVRNGLAAILLPANLEVQGLTEAMDAADTIFPEFRLRFYAADGPLSVRVNEEQNKATLFCERIDDRIKLEGKKIHDHSLTMGDIFVGDPPKLVSELETWHELPMATIVPQHTEHHRAIPVEFDLDKSKQSLEGTLRDYQAGWFSLRLYDASDELVSSQDFRFARKLEAIEAPDQALLPEQKGHEVQIVVLRHAVAASVELATDTENVMATTTTDGTELKVKPSEGNDGIEAWFRDGDDAIRLIFRIPWVRWRLINSNRDTQERFQDQCLEVEREQIIPNSPLSLEISLPSHLQGERFQLAILGITTLDRRAGALDGQTWEVPLRTLYDVVQQGQGHQILYCVLYVGMGEHRRSINLLRIHPRAEVVIPIEPVDGNNDGSERVEPIPGNIWEIDSCHNCRHAIKHFEHVRCSKAQWARMSYEQFFKKWARRNCGVYNSMIGGD